MEKKTIFEEINSIKKVANDFIGKLIECYGSPENETASIDMDAFEIITFNGVVKIKRVFNEGNSVFYRNDEGHNFTYTELPIESVLKIAHEFSRKNGIENIFDELFADQDSEE